MLGAGGPPPERRGEGPLTPLLGSVRRGGGAAALVGHEGSGPNARRPGLGGHRAARYEPWCRALPGRW